MNSQSNESVVSRSNTVLLVGVGEMGKHYAKILRSLGKTIIAIGRGTDGCEKFYNVTGVKAFNGGLSSLNLGSAVPDHAIVAVSEAQLGKIVIELIRLGVKNILVEKPGASCPDEIDYVANLALEFKSNVYVGYNRRFYASTIRAKQIINEDGGVRSALFEFTEWSHCIEPLVKEIGVKENWFFHNSTHVVDLAFYLAGMPRQIFAQVDGQLSWHKPARYCGSGRTICGALFSYVADWQCPGRWGLEIMTSKRRLILRPLEKLQIQKLGTTSVFFDEIDDQVDITYKPGLYRQVEAFFVSPRHLLTIQMQSSNMATYKEINRGS